MVAWSALLGAIALELFGHLNNVIDTPGALYESVIDHHGRALLG